MTNEEMEQIEAALAACINGGRSFQYGDEGPFDTVEDVAAHLAETARKSGDRRPGDHALHLWAVHCDAGGDEAGRSLIIANTGNGPTSEAHARFFAMAPWAIASLLAEVRRLRARTP